MKNAAIGALCFAILVPSCQQKSAQPVAESYAQAETQSKAVISGPVTARSGSLVPLHSKESIGDIRDWAVDISGVPTPEVITGELKESADQLEAMGYKIVRPAGDHMFYAVRGDEVFLASFPGKITVTLAVTDGLTIDVVTHVVTFTAGGPAPEPDPDPPVPVPPTGYGLTALVPGWLSTVPESARHETPAVKNVFTSVATLADAGKFKTFEEMNTATVTVIKSSVTDLSPWNGFGKAFNEAIARLRSEGKIKTPEDQADAYREIAAGL